MLVTVWGAYRGHYDKEFQLTMSQRTLMLQTISFLVYLLAGAAVYSHIEGWAYLDAVYWADFTLLTVGIGDYSPQTHLGRGLLFPFAIGGISASCPPFSTALANSPSYPGSGHRFHSFTSPRTR
jgi:potassium channel subfamily K